MTTAVVVKANHGWPVRVTQVNREQRGDIIVAAGAEGTFYVWDGQDLIISEIQPGEGDVAQADPSRFASGIEPILQFFAHAHLPANLQEVSRPFGELALSIYDRLPRNPERSVALRKLLEAKDAAVRARLFRP